MTNLKYICILFLAACTNAPDPQQQGSPDMGQFQLYHNVVVADNAKAIPPTRKLDDPEAQWESILKEEIALRFGDYDGGRNYHIALNVDGYALAPPGIPIVVSPKSILIVSANVWDDQLRKKLHDEPKQITVFEGGASAVLGSGLTQSAEEQMRTLSRNMAYEVQKWMLENPHWFDP